MDAPQSSGAATKRASQKAGSSQEWLIPQGRRESSQESTRPMMNQLLVVQSHAALELGRFFDQVFKAFELDQRGEQRYTPREARLVAHYSPYTPCVDGRLHPCSNVG